MEHFQKAGITFFIIFLNCTHRFSDTKLNEFTHSNIQSLRCVITLAAANLKSKYKPTSGSPKKLQSLRYQDTSQDSFRINNQLRKDINTTSEICLSGQKLCSFFFNLKHRAEKQREIFFFCKTNWPLKKLYWQKQQKHTSEVQNNKIIFGKLPCLCTLIHNWWDCSYVQHMLMSFPNSQQQFVYFSLCHITYSITWEISIFYHISSPFRRNTLKIYVIISQNACNFALILSVTTAWVN